MTLQLRITKAPDGSSAFQTTKTFDDQGGTIGRGEDNTWVLADPERILSSCHCELVCVHNQYEIIDLSTNGTFINNALEPLGKGARASLTHGDTLTLGDYVFAVEMTAAVGSASPFDDLPGVESGPVSAVDDMFGVDETPLVASESSVDPLQALDSIGCSGPEPAAHNGSHLAAPSTPVEESIVWPESTPENLIPDDWLDDPFPSPAAPEPARVAPEPDPAVHEPVRVAPVPEPAPVSRPVPPAPPKREPPPAAVAPAPAASAGADGDALIEAMGLDTSRLSAADRAALYPLVGRLTREVIAGLMQVLRSRASIKNEFRMNVTTIQPVENNPLKFSADVDEAIDNIFVRQSRAYKAPLDAIHEGFQEIAEHQLAMIAGMRSAFEHMLEDFDPERLQARFDKHRKPGVLGALQTGRYWRDYQAHYRALTDNMERSFQQIFGDEFVQAYQDQLKRLAASRSN